jgi:CRISPR-associated Csx2 family protein
MPFQRRRRWEMLTISRRYDCLDAVRLLRSPGSIALRRTLVSFLHTAPRHASIAPPPFRSANYDFGDQRVWASEFCGIALLDYLTARGDAPTRLLILGTPGSSWASLFAFVLGAEERAGLRALHERCAASTVAAADLEPWAPRLQQALRDRTGNQALDVVLLLTGYGSDESGQRKMIEQIGQHVDEGGHLVIDATHSLRHLPLIGVFSAIALRRLKSAALEGVYYGVLERSAPDAAGLVRTPVWRLDGLTPIAEWVAALSAFDKDGDYGVFAPLLEAAGFDRKAAGNLADAAFNEMIGNFAEAKSRLISFRKAFAAASLDGAARLFGEKLLARTAWAEEASGLYERQRGMAWAALERKDAARAATWGYEAFLTKVTRRLGRDPMNPNARDRARDRYANEEAYDSEHKAYYRLTTMRNQIAHIGFQTKADDPVHNEALSAMAMRDSCLDALRSYLEILIPLEADGASVAGPHAA